MSNKIQPFSATAPSVSDAFARLYRKIEEFILANNVVPVSVSHNVASSAHGMPVATAILIYTEVE